MLVDYSKSSFNSGSTFLGSLDVERNNMEWSVFFPPQESIKIPQRQAVENSASNQLKQC